MSNLIKSKFQLNYQDFETLSTEQIKNLDFINARIRQVEHIEKLKEEIAELELSLAAETKMVADDILRVNIFPRFGGYSDFIGQEFVSQEVIDSNPTFGNLAIAVEMTANDFKDENGDHITKYEKIKQWIDEHKNELDDDVRMLVLDDDASDYNDLRRINDLKLDKGHISFLQINYETGFSEYELCRSYERLSKD